jgi:hypothetical protein
MRLACKLQQQCRNTSTPFETLVGSVMIDLQTIIIVTALQPPFPYNIFLPPLLVTDG